MGRCLVTWSVREVVLANASAFEGLTVASGKTALREVLRGKDTRDVADGWIAVRDDAGGGVWTERCAYRAERRGRTQGGIVETGLEYRGEYSLGTISAYRDRCVTASGSDLRRWLNDWARGEGATVREGVYIMPDSDAARKVARDVTNSDSGTLFVIDLPDGADAVAAALDEFARRAAAASGDNTKLRLVQRECDKFRAVFAEEITRLEGIKLNAELAEISNTLREGQQ